MTAYDKGWQAAKKGMSRSSNPYNHPDHQWRSTVQHDLLANEWDEGYSNYDPDEEKERRREGARKAAATRKKNKEIEQIIRQAKR